MPKRLFLNLIYGMALLASFGFSLLIATAQAGPHPRGRDVLLYAILDTIWLILALKAIVWAMKRFSSSDSDQEHHDNKL